VTYSEVSVVLRARKLLGSYLLKFRPLFSFVLATFVHQAIQTGQQHSRMVHASVHKGSQPNIARNWNWTCFQLINSQPTNQPINSMMIYWWCPKKLQ